jgi:hypothetical protein
MWGGLHAGPGVLLTVGQLFTEGSKEDFKQKVIFFCLWIYYNINILCKIILEG